MISTLRKLPWNQTQLITMHQRHEVYNACFTLVQMLNEAIMYGRGSDILTRQLLKRLSFAAMRCPGLTVLQKDNIACMVGIPELEQRSMGQPRFPSHWVHQYSVVPKRQMPLDVLEVRRLDFNMVLVEISKLTRGHTQWYIAIIREETNYNAACLGVSQRSQMDDILRGTSGYWGHFWFEAGIPYGPEFDRMTLEQAGILEMDAIQRILSRAFDGHNN